MRCRIHADTAHRIEQYTHHTEVYRTHRYIEHSEIDTIEETDNHHRDIDTQSNSKHGRCGTQERTGTTNTANTDEQHARRDRAHILQ